MINFPRTLYFVFIVLVTPLFRTILSVFFSNCAVLCYTHRPLTPGSTPQSSRKHDLSSASGAWQSLSRTSGEEVQSITRFQHHQIPINQALPLHSVSTIVNIDTRQLLGVKDKLTEHVCVRASVCACVRACVCRYLTRLAPSELTLCGK